MKSYYIFHDHKCDENTIIFLSNKINDAMNKKKRIGYKLGDVVI